MKNQITEIITQGEQKIYTKIEESKNNILLDRKYYTTEIIYPQLMVINDNIDIIKKELNNFNDDWKTWSNIEEIYKSSDWKVIPLYGFGKYTKHSNNFPKVKEIISKLKDLTLFCLSKLGPNTTLNPHQGWSIISNINLRCQYGLYVPEKCGLWVEGETYNHQENKWITFDDSKTHSAFNYSEKERIVIIIDMLRPKYIKKGNSKSPVNEELHKFINES